MSRSQHLVLIGGGHSHAIALKEWQKNPIPNVKLTLITNVLQTPYSGMLPGYIAGFYRFEETHIDLKKLAQFAQTKLVLTTAIALADRFWILLTGGILGMLALRFLTGLFVRWLAEFVYLQDAAYLTVLAVGGRLLLKPCQPTYLPPEWMVLIMVAVSLSWGFSRPVVVE